MALSDIDKYRKRIAPFVGRCNIGGLDKKILILLKASSQSGVHLNSPFFLMEAKKEKALSSTQESNLDKAASCPVSC